jgi:peptidoglycan hydrolase-like protein with peptidoglycan-binding domain
VDGSPDDRAAHGRLRRRRNILLAVAGLAVVASAGGLLLATTIKSPAQQAAETNAPGLTRLTAPVQRTVIRTVVQANGMVMQPPEVSSLTDGGGGAASAGGGTVQQVVTKIFHPPGSLVSPGNVVIEVAGRPLFLLPGTVPAYRDLAPGESGSDVAQLQAGLQSLGFPTGNDASGVYGPGTAAAVAAFYHTLGYPPPTVLLGPKADRGPEVPLSEIMFVPRFPARVAALGGAVGSIPKGPLVTLSLGRPAIHGQLDPAYGSLVRPGMSVTITAQGSNASVRGTITSVGQQAQTAKSISGGLYLPMRIKPRGPLPPSMGPGQDVILYINAAQTAAPVLAVPEAAVFGGQDGRDYVSKVTGPYSAARVQVVVVTSGDGLVGVRPVPAGALRAGNLVVTGENYLTSPGGGRAGGGSQRPAVHSGRVSVRVVSP